MLVHLKQNQKQSLSSSEIVWSLQDWNFGSGGFALSFLTILLNRSFWITGKAYRICFWKLSHLSVKMNFSGFIACLQQSVGVYGHGSCSWGGEFLRTDFCLVGLLPFTEIICSGILCSFGGTSSTCLWILVWHSKHGRNHCSR